MKVQALLSAKGVKHIGVLPDWIFVGIYPVETAVKNSEFILKLNELSLRPLYWGWNLWKCQ